MSKRRDQQHFRGCLIGGAIGDALGWPVEFLSRAQIREKYGPAGITDLVPGSTDQAEITDDTQMTLFTAEGLLRAENRIRDLGFCDLPSVVRGAYLRWLHTQGYPKMWENVVPYDGWLIGVKGLHARRAPGNSCLSALLSSETGTVDHPINNSKGSGGVMRVAPVGLFCIKAKAFAIGCQCAALTHGHPSGYLSAGVLAHIIAGIIEGQDLETAISDAMQPLKECQGQEECQQAVLAAMELARSNKEPSQAISLLGEGWVAEEALAISIYCALRHRDNFRQALIAAVNHDGDSDTTGAITGSILGAYLGIEAIPAPWVARVEMAEVVIQIADDLLVGYQPTARWRERYP